ncbi:MAG: tetratricopeptide repeat protein, partial [Flavobacteriaceae bacterium]|nr:tetratricopeptide repeat protein [Flavobacteriaceae bacterium]
RKVFKEAVAYLVVAWLLLQVFSIVLPNIDAPDWVLKSIMLLMAIGFPIWLFVSWVYEVTPKGFKKTSSVKENHSSAVTNRRLSILILAALITAILLIIFKPNSTSIKPDADGKYAIAVLPFKDMSPEETQWFCDGVMDEILNHISTLKSLRVISRTSSETYKETPKKIPEIAKELDVDYILEGSVTLYNDKVKIMVQLISANDEHIWSKDYKDDFDLRNIFAIQQNVSEEIFKKLKITLSPEQKEIIEKIPTENMEAYQLVLKGLSNSEIRTKENLESSIKMYEEAIDLDPNYAEAYSGIAHAYYLLGWYNYLSPTECMSKSNSYIEKALDLDPNNSRAYGIKAMTLWKARNMEEVQGNLEKAIALNPNNAIIQMYYGRYFYIEKSDVNIYLRQMRIAQKLDPLSIFVTRNLFDALMLNNKIIEAEEYLNEMRFLFTDEEYFDYECHITAIKNKDWTAGIRYFETKIEQEPDNPLFYKLLGNQYDFILNDDINAIKYLKKAYELDSTNSMVAQNYFNLLTKVKRFKEAKRFMESENFKAITSREVQLRSLCWYYYHQENYLEVQEILQDSLMKNAFFIKAVNYAQLNDRKNARKDNSYSMKVIVFAILKEKDSMYYYLEKFYNNPYGHSLMGPNSRPEFDPYRKEDRFKALLKKQYLPITHLNE